MTQGEPFSELPKASGGRVVSSPGADVDRQTESRSTLAESWRQVFPLPAGMNLDGVEKRRPADPHSWPNRWARAYENVSVDGVVKKDQLPELLRAAGHRVRIAAEVIKSIVQRELTLPVLGPAEVFLFLQRYEDKVSDRLKLFFQNRADENGHLTLSLLNTLVHEAGFNPLPLALSEVIDEAYENVSGLEKGSSKERVKMDMENQITLPLFLHVIQLLSNRDGFSESEHGQILTVFKRFDRKKSNSVERSDLPLILWWLGHGSSQHASTRLLPRAAEMRDQDPLNPEAGRHQMKGKAQRTPSTKPGEGEASALDRDSFLTLMRWVRVAEVDINKSLFQELDTDDDRHLEVIELPRICRIIGFVISPELLFEAVRALKINHLLFCFASFMKLLEYFRRTEFLVEEELQEAKRTFKQFSKGSMSSRWAQMAARSLGFSVTPGSFWVDRYGVRTAITEAEFLKLFRDLYEVQVEDSKTTFRALAEQCTLLRKSNKEKAVLRVIPGFVEEIRKDALTELVKDYPEDWDFEDFSRVIRSARHMRRAELRKNSFFPKAELSVIRPIFEAQKVWGEEKVVPAKLTVIFGQLFPMMVNRVEVRNLMKQSLRVASKATSALDWSTFLSVLRSYEDLSMSQEDQHWQEAEQALGLETNEVDDFLDIFHNCFRNGVPALHANDLRFLLGGQEAVRTREFDDRMVELTRNWLKDAFDSKSESTLQRFISVITELRSGTEKKALKKSR